VVECVKKYRAWVKYYFRFVMLTLSRKKQVRHFEWGWRKQLGGGNRPFVFPKSSIWWFPSIVLCDTYHGQKNTEPQCALPHKFCFKGKYAYYSSTITILLCFSAQFFSVQTKFKPEAKIFLFLRKSTGTFCFPMAHYKNKESSWNHTFFIQLESQLGS
jgi:hypothetical protein